MTPSLARTESGCNHPLAGFATKEPLSAILQIDTGKIYRNNTRFSSHFTYFQLFYALSLWLNWLPHRALVSRRNLISRWFLTIRYNYYGSLDTFSQWNVLKDNFHKQYAQANTSKKVVKKRSNFWWQVKWNYMNQQKWQLAGRCTCHRLYCCELEGIILYILQIYCVFYR